MKIQQRLVIWSVKLWQNKVDVKKYYKTRSINLSENNIKKIREYCKENIEENKKDKLKFSIQIILIVVGMIHIIFADYLKEKLTIITGITTINISLINLIRNIKKKEYKTLDTMKIPENIVALLLGIMTLFKGQNAISFIAIIWGITGLRKGVKGFNIALYNKVNNKQYIGKLVYAIIETALSILLVFDPFEKVEEHLVILGFEMIIISLKVTFYDEKEYEEIDY